MITWTFCTGPAEYSNRYVHFPEIVFALVCLGISSVRLRQAGDRSRSFSLARGGELYLVTFDRGLKNFPCANPALLTSIVFMIAAYFIVNNFLEIWNIVLIVEENYLNKGKNYNLFLRWLHRKDIPTRYCCRNGLDWNMVLVV